LSDLHNFWFISKRYRCCLRP